MEIAFIRAVTVEPFPDGIRDAAGNLILPVQDFAFQRQGIFPDSRNADFIRVHQCQACRFPFVRIPPGLRTADPENFPAQLSGGEQQRVSIARALAKKPALLLCDEPTGALDYATGKKILSLLQDTSKQENMTVIIVTHNSALTAMADVVIHVKSGEVVKIVRNPAPLSAGEIEW